MSTKKIAALLLIVFAVNSISGHYEETAGCGCGAAPDCCTELDRAAAEAISFYQDPSEAKNRDERLRSLAQCCPRGKQGARRVALQNKSGQWVS